MNTKQIAIGVAATCGVLTLGGLAGRADLDAERRPVELVPIEALTTTTTRDPFPMAECPTCGLPPIPEHRCVDLVHDLFGYLPWDRVSQEAHDAVVEVYIECVEGGPATSDGRFHECNLITEHGVTEYIDAYTERCPDDALGGDGAPWGEWEDHDACVSYVISELVREGYTNFEIETQLDDIEAGCSEYGS